MFIFRNSSGLTLIGALISCAVFFSGCSFSDPVEIYFGAHGYAYPSDVSGVSMFGIRYSGIERDELLEPGAQEYIKEGLVFIRDYFNTKKFGDYTGAVNAIMVSDPVVYRCESGDIGLMVKVTGYGADEPGGGMKLEIKWAGKEKDLWKVENFAYFNRRGLDQWMHGGWVY